MRPPTPLPLQLVPLLKPRSPMDLVRDSSDSSKFMKKIVYVNRLDELAVHMRLDQLDIPEDVWKADSGYKPKVRVPLGCNKEAWLTAHTPYNRTEHQRRALPWARPASLESTAAPCR